MAILLGINLTMVMAFIIHDVPFTNIADSESKRRLISDQLEACKIMCYIFQPEGRCFMIYNQLKLLPFLLLLLLLLMLDL